MNPHPVKWEHMSRSLRAGKSSFLPGDLGATALPGRSKGTDSFWLSYRKWWLEKKNQNQQGNSLEGYRRLLSGVTGDAYRRVEMERGVRGVPSSASQKKQAGNWRIDSVSRQVCGLEFNPQSLWKSWYLSCACNLIAGEVETGRSLGL